MTDANVLNTAAAHAMRYLETLDSRPIGATTSVAELRAHLAKPFPETGQDVEQVIDELVRDAEGGAQVILTAVELDLADHFGPEAKDVASLASATATHPPSLSRMLRALAAIGVVHETQDHRYTLTSLGATLRTTNRVRSGPGRASF